MLYKLRKGVHTKKYFNHVLTVPKEISVFFEECFFSVEKSGNSIIFTSGASIEPTKEEIENYAFSDCRI